MEPSSKTFICTYGLFKLASPEVVKSTTTEPSETLVCTHGLFKLAFPQIVEAPKRTYRCYSHTLGEKESFLAVLIDDLAQDVIEALSGGAAKGSEISTPEETSVGAQNESVDDLGKGVS